MWFLRLAVQDEAIGSMAGRKGHSAGKAGKRHWIAGAAGVRAGDDPCRMMDIRRRRIMAAPASDVNFLMYARVLWIGSELKLQSV